MGVRLEVELERLRREKDVRYIPFSQAMRSIYELQKQLEVVADKLPDIYRAGTTLNIWLERETAQIEAAWSSPRWSETTRSYSAKDVVALRCSLDQSCACPRCLVPHHHRTAVD